MQNNITNGFPVDLDVNVDIRVMNSKGTLTQQIKKHNKATANMTEGIVRFLRGEFNKTTLNINSIGYYDEMAKYFIPSYIGFGNIGTNGGLVLPTESGGGFDSNDNTQYTDTSLRSEIFKRYNDTFTNLDSDQENHRIKLQRSTSGNSQLSDTYSLEISSTINFMSDFGFYYPNLEKVPFLHSDIDEESDELPKIVVTELGLFSGDCDDFDSRLLARLLLDAESPLVIDSSSTIIINWILGVYSVDDLMFRNGKSANYYDYKYTQRDTTFMDAEWIKE